MRRQIGIWFAASFLAVMLFTIQCNKLADLSDQEEVTPDSRAGILPDSLTTYAFTELVRELSEPGGGFIQPIIPLTNLRTCILQRIARTGALRVECTWGVGPEQNLTYIAEIRPHMAFVVDIRRQNMLLHLIYKALFDLSDDRAEFLSRLLSKPLNNELSYIARLFRGERAWSQSDSESSVADLIAYFEEVDPDIKLFDRNLLDIKSRLKRMELTR